MYIPLYPLALGRVTLIRALAFERAKTKTHPKRKHTNKKKKQVLETQNADFRTTVVALRKELEGKSQNDTDTEQTAEGPVGSKSDSLGANSQSESELEAKTRALQQKEAELAARYCASTPLHLYTRTPVHPYTRTPVHPYTRTPTPQKQYITTPIQQSRLLTPTLHYTTHTEREKQKR